MRNWTEPTGEDWTFLGASTREMTHCYHDYPARMIPQIAAKLLYLFGQNAKTLFDPYCGTGTSLVEGTLRGIQCFGTDINPLARLIAGAKTTPCPLPETDAELGQFQKQVLHWLTHPEPIAIPEVPGVPRMEYWFLPDVAQSLARLREYIVAIENPQIQRFFQVAFSETVREVSNTRNEEFKLYRYEANRLEQFRPNVYETMLKKLHRNRNGLECYLNALPSPPEVQIFDFDTVKGIPVTALAPDCIDIVITSPPYGDSHTTVAYGQYSRLSSAWLGFAEPEKVDRRLMGGQISKTKTELPSEELETAIAQVAAVSPKRAQEVFAFYADLFASIQHITRLLRPGGYICYVVGNRKVKGVVLPTDIAIKDFFMACGLEYVDTFLRAIPNKRMPLKNSPSNITGDSDATMTQEYIVVLRRPDAA